MKILLTAINAKYIHSNLAVYSLKEYAKDTGADIQIANFTINNQTEEVIDAIYRQNADVVAFSVYIWNVEYVKRVAREIKKICPSTAIWLGGPEVSNNWEEFLRQNKWADVIMLFEGEVTFAQLASGMEKSLIKGIAYREESNIIKTPERELLNMDELPFPYKDIADFNNRIIYYESSRGCPFSCSYCLSSIDKSVRFRSVEKVKEELKFFLDNKVPQVKFVDRTFNCNHKRTKELWRFLIENDNGYTNFHFEVSADLIDDEELEIISKMRKGLIQLEIGVQSTYEPTIKEIKRSMKFERLVEVVSHVKSFGNVHQHLDLIAGLPCEDYDTFKTSFNEVYNLKPEQLQLGFLKVLSGSYMHEMVKQYELVYTTFPPYEILKNKWISYEELRKLKQIEDMLENYYNSGQYNCTVNYLEKMFNSPFEFYDSLADFYTDRNLWGINHSRIMRYNYLYEFGIQSGADKVVLEEILTYDLYLKEKLKTRPVFAAELDSHKSRIREIVNEMGYKDKMCHVEPMTVEVTTGRISGRYYVLFDYENRDSLTGYARTVTIGEEGRR